MAVRRLYPRNSFLCRLLQQCALYSSVKKAGNNEPFKKGKVSIIKQKFCGTKHVPIEILKIKETSSVIKNFNLENKYLFGNLIPVKKGRRTKNVQKQISDRLKLYNSICHQPLLSIEEQSSSEFLSSVNPSDIYNTILKFPLVNKKNSGQNDDIVNEFLHLKNHLQSLCNTIKIPSVTAILQKTMPPERVMILENWKRRMIEEMGEENFKKYQNDMLLNGSNLHENINLFLSGTAENEIEILPANQGHWQSIRQVLPIISDVKLLEEHVCHPCLLYKGVVDCYAAFNDHLVVIDWKTSKKPKISLRDTYDSTLQIAAYIGALNFDTRFQYMANKGLIVIAYEDGRPANIHFMSENVVQKYWQQWLSRLKLYWAEFHSIEGAK